MALRRTCIVLARGQGPVTYARIAAGGNLRMDDEHERTATALSRRTCTALARGQGPVTQAYHARIVAGNLRLDDEQLSLASRLDELHSALKNDRFLLPDDHLESAAQFLGGSTTVKQNMSSHVSSLLDRIGNNNSKLLPPSSLSPQSSLVSGGLTGAAFATAQRLFLSNNNPKGFYIHGSVGVGKSMLMDTFYEVCNSGAERIRRRRLRCHFHEFMLDVHQRIHAYKKEHPKSDPIPPVAASIAKEARLLAFDEMQITDIADAMIMKRLFTILLDLGVVVVATSNRPPESLYEGGINRERFLPFIDVLNQRMAVVEMTSQHDYRRDRAVEFANDGLPTFVESSNDKDVLEEWFASGQGETRQVTIPVAMGRSIHINRANDTCAWMSFDELCKQPRHAADYIAIAQSFDTVICENVPQLCGDTYNEARRFVTLIDALYEARTRLVISSHVDKDMLFVGFDAELQSADGDEEIATREQPIQRRNGDEESLVIGEGGSSSSSSTTMIRTKDGDIEWSATGRIGVSLAQLSAVREVAFSFKRAESRLAEMSGVQWGKQRE